MPTLLERLQSKETTLLDRLESREGVQPEPNAFDGLIDPNEIEKKAKDVLRLADEHEVPVKAVMESYDDFSDNLWKIPKFTWQELGYKEPPKVYKIYPGKVAFESLKGVARFLERGIGGTFGGTMYNWLGQFISEGGRAVDWMSKIGTKNKHQIHNPYAQSIMATGQNISQRGRQARDWWAYQAATGWEAMDKDLKKKDPISYAAGRVSEGVASSALSVLAVYLSGGAAAPATINKGIEINRGLIALSTLSAAGGFEHAQEQKENFLWSTAHGLADGAIEYAMESTFLEGIKSASKIVVASKEAAEEFFTGMFQNTRAGVLENIKKGMSAYEAAKKAIISALKQSPWEVAAGFIGGYGIAGGAQLSQLYEQSKVARKEGEISPETQEIMKRRAARIEEIVEEGGVGALQKVRAEIKAGKEELAAEEGKEIRTEKDKISQAQKALVDLQKPIPVIREGATQADIGVIEAQVAEREQKIKDAFTVLTEAQNKRFEQAKNEIAEVQKKAADIKATKEVRLRIKQRLSDLQQQLEDLEKPVPALTEGHPLADPESTVFAVSERDDNLARTQENIEKTQTLLTDLEKTAILENKKPIRDTRTALDIVADYIKDARRIVLIEPPEEVEKPPKPTPAARKTPEAPKIAQEEEISPVEGEVEGEIQQTVYHGTDAVFKEFDKAKMLDKEGLKLGLGMGKGTITFSTLKGEARKYGKNIIEAKVIIKKPFVIKGPQWADMGYERWKRVRDGWKDTTTDIYWGKYKTYAGRVNSFVKQLKKEGYDSIILGHPKLDKDLEITVFDTKQIVTEGVKPAVEPAVEQAKAEKMDAYSVRFAKDIVKKYEDKLARGEKLRDFEKESLDAHKVMLQAQVEPEAKLKETEGFVGTLGGVPVEPPGLTEAERVHLGKREGDALRAGQKLGLKIGYKKGYQEAALTGRRKLNVLRMDKAIAEKSKEDVRGTIQKFVPKDQQYKFMTRLARVKDAKGVQKLTGEIEHFIEQYEHRAAVRHFKNFVSGIKSKYKSGEVAFGQLPDNLRDKVMNVIDGYDAVQLSELKADELIKHKEHIQKVAGSIADAFGAWENLDEQGLDILQLPNYRIRELQRLEKTPVAELGTEEIEFIQDELEGLLAVNEKKGQIKARIRAEKLHTKVTGASNEIYSRGETKAGEIKEPGYAKRFAGIEQANLRTLAGFATKSENENTVNVLVDQLYEANRKRAGNYKRFIEYTRKQRDKRNITDADVAALENPVTVTLGGKDIKITQGSLLSLWMDTEAEGNMRRLLTAKGHNLRSDKGKLIRVGKIKLYEIQDALEKLPEKAKSIGELAFDVNANMQAPALNETWIELYNYPIARHERHWPFPREIEKLVEGQRAEISISLEMQGRYLPRTGGTERHKVIPFTKQFMMGLQMDAAKAAMTDSMEQAKALLANKKWRTRMKDSGQQPVLDAITTMLRRSQGMVSDQSVADLIAARFLSRAGKSLLSARPSGMLIQTASVSAGYGVIGPKHFLSLKVPTKAEIEHLKEISPSLWLRWEAKQFDYALGAASAQTGFQTLIMGKQPISDRLVNHYTWGDQIAVFYGWSAAQNKVAAETTLRKGTPEFEKASLDLLHRWMETQPQWDILHRSLMTSHPSPFFRGSMMFMSARNAQYNVLLSAYDDYSKDRINEAEFATRVGGVVQANIQVSLARRLMRYGVKAGVLAVLFGLLEEDRELIKEIAKEEAVKDIKKVPFESVMNMLGLGAFGQIGATIGYEAVRQIEGKTFTKKLSEARTGNIIADLTMDFMQFGIDSAKLAKQLWTQEVYVDRKRMGEARWKDTATELVNTTAEIVAQIMGMPYSGPRSDIVWPTQSVLRGMSRDEYEKKRKEFNEARRKALQEAVKKKVKEGELPRKR